jgi:hypothetical protein
VSDVVAVGERSKLSMSASIVSSIVSFPTPTNRG